MLNPLPLTLISACLLSAPLSAQWLTLSGRAPIGNDGLEQARQQAIHNALARSAQGETLVNGVLAQAMEVTQIGEYQLLSETISDDTLEVTLRADVRAVGNRCEGAGFRVALTLPRAQVVHREHLVPGSLYEFDAALTRLLSNTINGEATSLFAHDRDDISLDYRQLNREYGDQWARDLSRDDNSQYVVALSIDDLTLDPHQTTLGWFEDDRNRYFGADLNIYDGLTGQMIWHKRYRTQGDWPFKRSDAIELGSSYFWNSEYGQQIRQQVVAMAQDIDTTLHCRPLHGRVLGVDGERVTISLGSRHGVRVGDRLSLQNRQQGELGWWNRDAQSDDTLVIRQVQLEQAIGVLEPGSSYTRWQPMDMVRAHSRGR
ncbi:hypothetical protein FCL40_16325 [Ferrimonas sediminicola]|uniref:Flagellar assembly protein T, C-terminal domain n=1 Tax=Ferrimonas sediminicola TaxID=2569538 RepID=A0A4U1B970_9GAMM|nr:flagellar assembly protein T N-terminal domain-containing protein [Ferrimonas sediminicola]TKB47268.1 hypothetical protein FCL40_16325 [Ferrimonas sediminicola]